MKAFLANGEIVELVHKGWLTRQGGIALVEDWNKDLSWDDLEKQLLPLYEVQTISEAYSDYRS